MDIDEKRRVAVVGFLDGWQIRLVAHRAGGQKTLHADYIEATIWISPNRKGWGSGDRVVRNHFWPDF